MSVTKKRGEDSESSFVSKIFYNTRWDVLMIS